MELEIDRAPFLAALAPAAAVADRKTTMPILANVLLRTDGQRLGIAATDMAITVSAELDAKVRTSGSCTTPARELHAFVKSLLCESVKITLKDTILIVRADKARCELPILPAGDFPKLPDHRELKMAEVAGATLREILAKTCYAVAIDSSRPHLCGVHLSAVKGIVTAEAADSHRAAQLTRPLAVDLPSLLLPLGAASEIQRLIVDAEKVRIAAKDDHLYVATGTTVIAAKLQAGTFPNLAGLVPERKTTCIASRAELLAAFQRVGLFADMRAGAKNDRNVADGGGVKVTLRNNAIELVAQQMGGGKGEDEVAVEYKDKVIEFGINGRYAIEALESLDGDKVTLQVEGDKFSPLVVRGAGFDSHLAVIMKMGL
jgi:DNA polymerase-3 subunit beta